VRLSSLPTPQVLVDRARLGRNIARMQERARTCGRRLRPHAKTHKSPAIARMQIAEGAVGICCAKLGEAEVFAAAGIQDIRLPYPVNPFDADRLIALMDRCRLSIIVDHPAVAASWSDVMRVAGRVMDVLVKVDVGFHRCGIDPDGAGAATFVAEVAALPGLRLRGLLSHAGHAYHATSAGELARIARDERDTLLALADRVRARGVQLEEISVGATPTARFSAQLDGITELRPGNYVFHDRTQVGLGAATWEDCALTVLATVVSRPCADRLILDCGSKTLTTDAARGFGDVRGHGTVLPIGRENTPNADLLIERLSEEHATVRVSGSGTTLQPGDRVRVLPNHSCVVSNLVDDLLITDDGDVVETVEVAARGRIR
jgi:D-serine deaminase-like pyridoxal phosphate-dependent protein